MNANACCTNKNWDPLLAIFYQHLLLLRVRGRAIIGKLFPILKLPPVRINMIGLLAEDGWVGRWVGAMGKGGSGTA